MYLKSLFLVSSILLFACVKNNVDANKGDPDAFLPLEVGNSWTYQIVKADYDISKDGFRLPHEFKVEVVDKATINNMEYYAVKNYFFPGPLIPDTSYLRAENNRVYVIVNDIEYMLYSFENAEGQNWHLPMRVNNTLMMDYYMSSSSIDNNKAEFLWHMGLSKDRAENYWTDVFQKGQGRIEVRSFSQAYGETIWALKTNN